MPLSPLVVDALDEIEGGATAAELESDLLEFKTQGRSIPDALKDLAEAAACFANGRGGTVVVGVADDVGGPAAFVGTGLDATAVQRRVFELTDPRLTIDVTVTSRAGQTLLILSVPTSPDVHAVSGRCTERIGTGCQPMSTSRIATLVADRRGDDWSAEDSGEDLDVIDPVALVTARAMLGQSGDRQRQAFARASDQDLLRALGVFSPQSTLLRAGALLFGSPTSAHDRLVYVHRRTPAGQLVANEHLSAPVLPAIQRVFDLIEARLDRTPVNLPGGQQLQLADLPPSAVREAVVNAVMHRDYRRSGAVQVEHTATRLVVTSPGPFVSGVTVDNVLTTSSRSRNPLLSNAIRVLGLAETAGTGVDHMYAAMAGLGHQPPAFAADLDRVTVTLLGGAPNAFVARYVATLPKEESQDADTMLVLLALLTQRTVTAKMMSPLLQKAETEVLAVLDRLSADPVNLLERTRETTRSARPVYRLREHVVAALGSALTYHRRTVDQSDRKIIGLVREAGEVNSRMVKLLLDLDTGPASRVLGDLVDRGILVKTSKAQRGPSVTYGPGPAFPATPKKRASPPRSTAARTTSDRGSQAQADRGGVAAGGDQPGVGAGEVDSSWASVDAASVVGAAAVGGVSGGAVRPAGR